MNRNEHRISASCPAVCVLLRRGGHRLAAGNELGTPRELLSQNHEQSCQHSPPLD